MAGGFIALPSKAEADIPNADPGYVNVFSDADAADRPASKDSAGVVDTFEGAAGPAGTNGTNGTNGADGADGADGVGVPVGGTAGQLLAKSSSTDFDTGWVSPAGEDEILDIPTAETDASLVLAPDGAGGVEFRAEAGGATPTRVLLGTYVAAASATLDCFTRNAAGQSGALIQTDYTKYEVSLEGLQPATNSVELIMRLATGAGPTVDSTGVYDWEEYRSTTGAAAAGGAANATGWRLVASPDNLSNSATTPYVGLLRLFDPNRGTVYPRMLEHGGYLTGGSTMEQRNGHGIYKSTTGITAMQFLMSSGNITGTVKVYGLL